MPLWIAFVIGVVVSWGAYVPVLHEGQSKLGGAQGPGGGSLRAFLCVGVAYFITAVIIPVILLFFKVGGEGFDFRSVRGTSFALLGGIAGAAGALCIILALKAGGKPLYVVPLVFAGAPVMSTIISLLWHPPAEMPGAWFYVGIVMAAAGAGLVLYSRPQAAPAGHGPAQPHAQAHAPRPPAPASLPTEH